MKSTVCTLGMRLALLLGTTLASPIVDTRHHSHLYLYLCSEANFEGNCVNYTSPAYTFNNCYSVADVFPPGQAGGVSSASALTPTKNAYESYCILFPNDNCVQGNPNTGGELALGIYDDMSDPSIAFDKQTASFECRSAPWQ